MKPVKIGLLGLGTVGSGTVQVLIRNAEEINRRAGRVLQITHAAARDLKYPELCTQNNIVLTDNAEEIVNHPEIDIVLELMGGIDFAKKMVLQAIANGKHVITANKALLATHGNEIFAKAQEKQVIVAFEAAVAGGIPIIKALRESLAGNRIEWLAGIINGTGNFILTEMRDKGRDFAEVLAEAQRLGYAEADPAFDVEGIDAAHKLTILASIAFGIPLQFNRVYTEGITQITSQDVNYAAELGYQIKHLGIARQTPQGIEMRVHPTLIPKQQLMANVDGVLNAVLVHGDAVGSVLFCGAGAGAEPTASSVAGDLVDVVRALTTDPENRVPHLAFQPSAMSEQPILPMHQVETAYYLRLRVLNKAGVLAQITEIFAAHHISIEAIIQKDAAGRAETATEVSLVLLSHRVKEQEMNAAIAKIEALTVVKSPLTRIRMESLR